MGAIGLGGLTGFIYSLRKGTYRRMLYTTLGAGTMAALCYPREAQDISRLVYDQARMYTMIAYHFLNGGKIFSYSIFVIFIVWEVFFSYWVIKNEI